MGETVVSRLFDNKAISNVNKTLLIHLVNARKTLNDRKTDPLVVMASMPGIEMETAEYGMGFRLKLFFMEVKITKLFIQMTLFLHRQNKMLVSGLGLSSCVRFIRKI